jgi:tetratricopeptide (TPR) repeat protein
MVWARIAIVVLAAEVTAGAAVVRPTPPPPTPPPVTNPLAAPFKGLLDGADRQVAETPEWLRIHAGVVIEDWGLVRTDALVLAGRFPRSADVQIALAVGLEGSGDHAAAETALRKAVELQPGHLGAWLMIAQMDLAAGREGDAAAALSRAHELRPSDLGTMLALADALARSGDTERATAVLVEALAVAPDNVPAWVAYLQAATRSSRAEQARAEFNQLRRTSPGTAAAIAHQLPGSAAGALPTPIPPTPRPTPRTDTPRLVMGAAPAAGQGGRGTGVWNQAALAFEAKLADIAKRARPLTEMVRHYDMTCHGGYASGGGAAGNPGGAAAAGEEGAPESASTAKAAAAEIDWKTIWARSAAWTQAAASEPTSECRAQASDILALANATRSAVDKALQSTTGSGIAEADKKRLLQDYNLFW